jgi:ABC-type transport system substrate-binding protein
MRFSRIGENLWQEWDGKDYPTDTDDPIVYYAFGWADTDDSSVRRALASTIQRDGVADSLGQGYEMIDNATIKQGWACRIGGDYELTFWDEEDAEYVEDHEEPLEITWVEVEYDG